jgi:hypothetical protein
MLCRVAPVGTDVSEEHISIITMLRIGELGTMLNVTSKGSFEECCPLGCYVVWLLKR